ncbi:MAG: response regulator [Phycisphaerae bacterium]
MRSKSTNPEEVSVLIVEDEPRLRSILTEGVRECGYQAGGVRTGEEALAAMESHPADIAILDLNLPGMDGLQCFEKLRERWLDVAVVILTGFGTLDAAQRAIQLGVVEFLTKPASLGDLEKALHRAWQSLPACSHEEPAEESSVPVGEETDADTIPATRALQDLERKWILSALERHHGNRDAAAAELGISVRKLYYRLSEYQEHGGDAESNAD